MKLVELLQIRAATALDDLPEPQVRELQTALGEAGFDPQGVDGTMAPDTKSAWAEFKDATSEDNPDVIGPGSVGE
ncbi:MAG: hypothetical protein QOD51_2172, partial [Candidatus Eremiobacteraeota bacterium]|nr:hypothetical protein [Candidatus Eremiobacteraeota bacterium]